MSWDFERIAGPFSFTEGPAWDGTGLVFTDIYKNRILLARRICRCCTSPSENAFTALEPSTGDT